MHIVIEGFDGTGKSTLAGLLSRATGWPAYHQSPRPPRSIAEYADMYDRAMFRARQPDLISDRWPPISDHCYGAPGNRAELVEIVESLRLARVDRIIHCDVDDVTDLRIEARPGDAQDAEQTEAIRAEAERVLEAYRALMCELRARGFEVLRHVLTSYAS